jgi:hypothetical protein
MVDFRRENLEQIQLVDRLESCHQDAHNQTIAHRSVVQFGDTTSLAANGPSMRFCLALIAILGLSSTVLLAEEPLDRAPKESTQQSISPTIANAPAASLNGVWSRRAVPNGNGSNDMGTQYKFFAGKHWLCAHCDDSGYVVYALGGTYKEAGGVYTETDEFATRYCQGMIGQQYSFKVSVDDKEFWQIGVNNDYTEKYAKDEGADDSPLANSLQGVWARTTKPYANAPDAELLQYKFFAGQRWFMVNVRKDGFVLTTCGGTFQLDGDELTETTKYSSEFTAHKIDAESRYKVEIKADSLVESNLNHQIPAKWKRPE